MLDKIRSKYVNLQAPVKASLWFLVCGFLQKGISMLTTPIFTRIMTDVEYGRYSIYNSWFEIVQIIVSLNLAAGVYTRGLVKNEKDQDRFSSSMLGLSTTCILVWTVIYFLFHNAINDFLGLSTLLMTAMLLDIWAHAAYQFWSNRERVNYRYKRLVCLTAAYVVLRPLFGVICVLNVNEQHQAEARIISTVLVNLVLFSALYFSVVGKGRQFFNKDYWIYGLKFNIPLVPHYLSQVLLNQSDRIMINRICGSSEAAYYSVAYTIAVVLQILNNSISSTMNPWIYKSLKNKEYEKIGKISYYVLALIAVMNLAVIVCAPELMKIMAPGSYQTAIWVIPPVTVSVYFSFLYNLFATFEYYFEKTHYVAIASICSAVINIVLNAIFIPIYGFVAAGYTTLLCYILYAVTHYSFMKKTTENYLGNAKIYDVKIIVALGGCLLLMATLSLILYKTVVIRYGILCLLVVFVLWKRKELIVLAQTIRKR